MSTTTIRHTTDEYFEVEFASNLRHEYVDGEILEMVGGSTAHNDICTNLYGLLIGNFRKPKFRTCCGNSRMRIPAPIAYLYPDAAVVKGACEYEAQRLDTVLNPAVLFEILSPSTERFDRGRKFDLYQTIVSLEEYLLISQQNVIVERFSRELDGRWKSERFTGLNTIVRLESLSWDLLLADLYADIDFTAQ